MISPRRHSRRNAPAGRHTNAAGGVEVPTRRSHAHSEPLTFSEGRDGEQVQFPDIAPEAVDGGVHIKEASLVRALFADTIIPPEVVSSLPSLPDTSYPVGSLVFLTTDAKLYRNTDGSTWSRAVDGADIVADSITAGSIAAGAIGADELAAELVLASVIKTASSGARLELDEDGLRSYDGSEVLQVQLPTDGSAVYVKGQIQATELLVLGDAVLRGDSNAFALGSISTLEAQQAAPTQAPSIFKAHDTTTRIIVPDDDVDLSNLEYQRAGLDYDSTGGAGGATKVFWTTSIDNLGIFYLVEMLCSDMTVNRFAQIDESDLFFASVQDVRGVARHGASVYVLMKVHFDLSDQWWVARYNASDLSFNTVYTSVSFPNATPRGPVIASNGTNIYVADKASGTGTIKWNLYNASMVKQGSTVDTSFNSDSNDYLRDMAVGNFDFGAARIALFCKLDNEIELFDSAGSRQANEVFPGNGGVSAEAGGLTYGDAIGDGARFWSMGAIQNAAVTRHTNWVWTTASSIYWVGYTWYDSAGTTHETTVGPRASITMGRRQMLGVTMASIPGLGGADEPNNHRIYMFPNATAPATTSLDLQTTTAADNVYLTTYDSGGAAPPVANDFPSGTPATLRSAGDEWVLEGDGSAAFTDVTISGALTVDNVTVQADAAGDAAIEAEVVADANPRFRVRGSGNVEWGDGTATVDARLRRDAAASLLVDDGAGGDANFKVTGAITANDGEAGQIQLGTAGNIDISDGHVILHEANAPAGEANMVKIYVDDNAGTTRLRAVGPGSVRVTLGTF